MSGEEIRKQIIEVTLNNGGHLASSLGAVEIAMALREVFDPERDRIVWDVGHQAYAWKILTKRDKGFETLRKFGGLSGFPNPCESKADAAIAGHAGVAISVAEGIAAAGEILKRPVHAVAVVGDAAIANGTSFEAINNCVGACEKVIVVLNDNEMSISRPTGALARMFGKLITDLKYNRVKAAAEATGHRLHLTFLREYYHRLEKRIKGLFVGNAYFEGFGLRYIGPVDGHNLKALKAAFTVARDDKRSVVVHVVTKKGNGFKPAEEDPTKWHGVSAKKAGMVCGDEKQAGKAWSSAFGDALCNLAEKDERVMALTAGMRNGTGIDGFAKRFPQRFRDVGIAEGHLVAYSAGLAAGGMRPFVAVYSTFLQRAIDQIMHDVCIANLPVVFAVDRAGIVGTDGVTHQGLYDFAMLKCLPNLTICQPKDEDDLRELIVEAMARKGPTVIRYPRGRAVARAEVEGDETGRESIAIWATGDWYAKAKAVAKRVGGIAVHARYLKPFDEELLRQQRKQGMKIVSLENGSAIGGFGESIGADLKLGWPDEFIEHGEVCELERKFGLDEESLIGRIKEFVGNGGGK